MVSTSEHIERPMAETTIQEKLEKEKRQRDEQESERPQETAKRRELSPIRKSEGMTPENPSVKSSLIKSGFASAQGFSSAQGFASLASTPSIFEQHDPTGSSIADVVTKDSSITASKEDAPKAATATTVAIASGFGGFGKSSAFSTSSSGGFSSFSSAQNLPSGGFSSLLDTSNGKSSIFGSTPAANGLDGKRPTNNNEEDSNDEQEASEEVDEEQYIAVKGLSKTDVPTGEETEICIHQVRAKLFAFDAHDSSAGWKERGVGTLRALQLDSTSSNIQDSDKARRPDTRRSKGRMRLVMRADAVLRVILNLPIHHKYLVQPGGDSMGAKTIRIFGVEDGVGTWFALRVGSEKAAEELREVVENGMKLSARSALTSEKQDTVNSKNDDLENGNQDESDESADEDANDSQSETESHNDQEEKQFHEEPAKQVVADTGDRTTNTIAPAVASEGRDDESRNGSVNQLEKSEGQTVLS